MSVPTLTSEARTGRVFALHVEEAMGHGKYVPGSSGSKIVLCRHGTSPALEHNETNHQVTTRNSKVLNYWVIERSCS